jgi:hypothetical protein
LTGIGAILMPLGRCLPGVAPTVDFRSLRRIFPAPRENEEVVPKFLRHAAIVAALVFSVTAVSAPGASAQSGSRLCGRLVAEQNSRYALYLVEVDKDSAGWGEFDKDFQACENAQQRWVNSRTCTYVQCYEYVKCEDISRTVGWSGYPGRPAGYRPDDICTSMTRRTGYLLKLSGGPSVFTTDSFATS